MGLVVKARPYWSWSSQGPGGARPADPVQGRPPRRRRGAGGRLAGARARSRPRVVVGEAGRLLEQVGRPVREGTRVRVVLVVPNTACQGRRGAAVPLVRGGLVWGWTQRFDSVGGFKAQRTNCCMHARQVRPTGTISAHCEHDCNKKTSKPPADYCWIFNIQYLTSAQKR